MTFPSFTTGEVLTAADMNAVGLWLVKKQTIGSAVSTAVVTDAFSSSYDNYLITVNGGTGSTTASMQLQLGSTTSGYRTNYIYTSWNSTVAGDGTSTGANYSRFGHGTTTSLFAYCVVINPNLAQNTYFASSFINTSDGGPANGMLANSTQYTGFTIIAGSGTYTGGTIRVYGYRN
jgi:hypothetical protein